jgi:hypothetical protein
VDERRIAREGLAVVCPQVETDCMEVLDAYAGHYPRAALSDATLARRYLGVADNPVRYRILIVPPNGEPQTSERSRSPTSVQSVVIADAPCG